MVVNFGYYLFISHFLLILKVIIHLLLILYIYNSVIHYKSINITVNNINSIVLPLPCTQPELFIKNDIENIFILIK